MKKVIYAVAVLFVLSMISTSSYAAITDGLVAYYTFDAGTPKDNSGNGNNGVFIGDPKPACRKQILAVTTVLKRARLADQTVDHMPIVDVVLASASQPRETLHLSLAVPYLQMVRANPHFDAFAN